MLKRRIAMLLSLLLMLTLLQPITAGATAAKTGVATSKASTSSIVTQLPLVAGAIAAKTGAATSSASTSSIVTQLPLVAGAIAAKTGAAKASAANTSRAVSELTESTFVEPISMISPCMAYSNSFITILSIDKDAGKAYVGAVFTGYSHLTKKVEIQLTLQKRGFLGLWWNNVERWSLTTYKSYADMERIRFNLAKGTYRVKGVYTAYGFDGGSETYTQYSSTQKY